MDGVTILNTEIIPAVAEKNYWWVGIIVFILIFLMIAFAAGKEGMSFIGASVSGLIAGAVFGLIIGVLLFFIPTPGKPEYTIYEATISDKVSLAEFNKKYEVVEMRGEIYVIKERSK